MKTGLFTLFLVLTVGCGGSPGVPEAPLFTPSAKPMVILEIRDAAAPPPLEGFAWCFFTRSELQDAPSLESLLTSADSEGRLLMLVEQEPGTELEGMRQHMFVLLDQFLVPVSISPEGLAAELEGFTLTPDAQGHGVILDLFSKYRPDLLFISIGCNDLDALAGIVGFWREGSFTKDFRLFVYSPPSLGSRGWCAMSWRDVPVGCIPGLSFGGFTKTLGIFAGLPWDPSVFTGVPAVHVLQEQTQ